MATIDFNSFEVLTFDCCGTLIDWERGIDHALTEFVSAGHAARYR